MFDIAEIGMIIQENEGVFIEKMKEILSGSGISIEGGKEQLVKLLWNEHTRVDLRYFIEVDETLATGLFIALMKHITRDGNQMFKDAGITVAVEVSDDIIELSEYFFPREPSRKDLEENFDRIISICSAFSMKYNTQVEVAFRLLFAYALAIVGMKTLDMAEVYVNVDLLPWLEARAREQN